MTTAFTKLPPALREVIQRYQSPHSRNSSVNLESNSAREHLLDPAEKNQDGRSDARSESLPAPTRERMEIAATRPLVAIAILSILLIWLGSLTARRGQLALKTPVKEEAKFLYVAIPHAEQTDLGMCRTILSAQVLNYPVPIWISWDESTFKEDQPYQVQHYRARLRATNKWLNKLPPSSDSSLIILLDEQATWFQLRPEVLLKRYYAITKEANERLRPQGVNQTILFAAQDECSSDPSSTAACVTGQRSLAVPEDHQGLRFLNSAVLIGPVKDVRTLMARVAQKYNSWPGNPPQDLFASIYTEQQFSREYPTPHNRDYELKMGIDYQSLLSYSTRHDPDLAQFSPLSSPPSDILDSMAPFWTVSGVEPDLPHNATWQSIPLLHHPLVLGDNTPAMIHHQPLPNPDGTQPSSYAEKWWSQVWFGRYARWLYSAMIHLPPTVVASVVDNEGVRQVFWHATHQFDKAGVRLAEDWDWRHFTALCGEEQVEDVFGDHGGAWFGTFGW